MGGVRMKRNFPDWLQAYLEYTAYTEPPPHMRFWCGVSAVAGALRRKVWIEQVYFRWYPNFYIVLVAPPGIVSKSTTAGVAMNLLRQVEGVKFGPDIVTWPQLVAKFAESAEGFEYPQGSNIYHTMSPLTLESSEFGNLLNPQDREMVDLFVTLWDGKQGAMTKETKTSGSDEVQNPWINLIACTTPSWIAGSSPDYMIGGGFTSRCVFVFVEKKHREIAYPARQVPKDIARMEQALVADLRSIASLVGEYRLTEEAYAWGEIWYSRHYASPPPHLNDDRFGGYLARKQTHIHKLAMVLAASTGADLWITEEHLAVADRMVSDLEPDMVRVFERIGRSEESMHSERFVRWLRVAGEQEWDVAFRHVHRHFPGLREYEDMLAALIKARLVVMTQKGSKVYLSAPLQ